MALLYCLALAGVDPARPVGTGVGAPSGPTAVAERAMTSLDFVSGEGISQVLVGVSAGEHWSLQTEGSTLALVLPGVSVPQSLARDLPTHDFGSVVLGVQAREVGDGARVSIQLADAATPTVDRDGDRIVLTFTEAASAAGPAATVSTVGVVAVPVQGAYTSEFLVDEQGQLSAPGVSLGTVADGTLVVGGFYDGGLADLSAGAGAGLGLGGSWSSGSSFGGGSTAAPISLDLVDADIHQVLRLIAEVSGLNVVASDEVSGSVTVRLEDVPWDLALQAILTSKGLAATVNGGILQVGPQLP